VLLVITSGQREPSGAEITNEGRFIGKHYGVGDLANEVDNLMRNRSSAPSGRASAVCGFFLSYAHRCGELNMRVASASPAGLRAPRKVKLTAGFLSTPNTASC